MSDSLARALGLRGSILSACERHDEAGVHFAEAVRVLHPAARKYNAVLGPLLVAVVRGYLSAMASCDREPEAELLELAKND